MRFFHSTTPHRQPRATSQTSTLITCTELDILVSSAIFERSSLHGFRKFLCLAIFRPNAGGPLSCELFASMPLPLEVIGCSIMDFPSFLDEDDFPDGRLFMTNSTNKFPTASGPPVAAVTQYQSQGIAHESRRRIRPTPPPNRLTKSWRCLSTFRAARIRFTDASTSIDVPVPCLV